MSDLHWVYIGDSDTGSRSAADIDISSGSKSVQEKRCIDFRTVYILLDDHKSRYCTKLSHLNI